MEELLLDLSANHDQRACSKQWHFKIGVQYFPGMHADELRAK